MEWYVAILGLPRRLPGPGQPGSEDVFERPFYQKSRVVRLVGNMLAKE